MTQVITIEEIAEAVQFVAGVKSLRMEPGEAEHVMIARYVAIEIMHQEGHKAGAIAALLGIDRSTVYYVLTRTETMIYERPDFKCLYLGSMGVITAKEDAA